jgi:hypothetical protein
MSVNAPFVRAGLMCESLSLGAISSMEPGKTHAYDAANARFPGSETLSKWARKPYRSGWQVENL